jgi:hypothetical protein
MWAAAKAELDAADRETNVSKYNAQKKREANMRLDASIARSELSKHKKDHFGAQ